MSSRNCRFCGKYFFDAKGTSRTVAQNIHIDQDCSLYPLNPMAEWTAIEGDEIDCYLYGRDQFFFKKIGDDQIWKIEGATKEDVRNCVSCILSSDPLSEYISQNHEIERY